MKLSYRGVKYELNPSLIEVNQSETCGKYRGLPIRMTSVASNNSTQTIHELTYRGNKYTGL
jgi:Domain of unknown function (DUF4278)